MSEPWPESDGDGVSPDAPPVETPTLLDYASEDELIRTAIDFAQASLPEWSPRAGNTEVVLIEALAQMITVLAFALDEVPARVVEHMMALYGVPRDMGGPAVGVARFEVQPAQAIYRIPEGTTLRLTLDSTSETLDFTTDGSLEIITANGLTGEVSITAVESGAKYNGMMPGTSLDVVDPLPFVERVRISFPTSGGRDEETDASLQSRASAVFGRLVSTLVLPEHFRMAALQLPTVGRTREVDLFDPAQPDAEQSVGHLTIFVTDPFGQPLSTIQKNEVTQELRAQALASLIIHVEDPVYVDANITVEVTTRGQATPTEVQARVENELRSWLSPASFPWSDAVTQFMIVARVSAVPGVGRVLSVTPDRIELAGPAALPRINNLTVTATQGGA